jgi:phosphoglycolate phosphatase
VPSFQPVICDLDGTIANTAPAIFESLHLTCAAFDIALAHDADLSFCLGPPLHWCLERLGIPHERMPDAIATFETAHTERIGLVAAMPGADVVIHELVASGVSIGVATIKPEPLAKVVLQTIGLGGCVKTLRARSDDMDPRTKTDLVREALAELPGAAPLYIGDHDYDEQAAATNDIAFMRYPENSWDDIRAAVLDGSPTRWR